jgi:uncharacterized membrane protein
VRGVQHGAQRSVQQVRSAAAAQLALVQLIVRTQCGSW